MTEDYRPIADAPRDSTWIDLRYRNGTYETTRMARSSGRGDMPGIWRFDSGGCLRFADERGWEWRALDPEIAAELARLEDERRALARAA